MGSKIKKTILSVSIAIILLLFVIYGISTFYVAPKYEDFCDYSEPVHQVETEEECEASEGKWTDYSNERPVPRKVDSEDDISEGWCNFNYYCNKDYDAVREHHNRNVFIIAVIIGLVAVLAGGIILKLESVSTGIMGGGALTIIYGILRYWGDAEDWFRFIILGIVLVILIWIGYKKLEKK
ncbi:MAG: hypothetical protein L6408_08260 [Nanoarchaeota archaeon]|nr:hypothetical protein [Nanoarchaeota archaeon]